MLGSQKQSPREGSICPSWWERHLTLPDLTLPKKTMCIRNAKRELKRWQSGPERAVRMMFQSPHAIITSRNAPLSTWPIVHFGFPNAVSKCSKGLYNSLHSHRVLHCGLLGRHHFHWGLICPQKFLLWALQGPRVMTAACSQVKSLKPCIYCGKEGRKLQGTFSYSTRKFTNICSFQKTRTSIYYLDGKTLVRKLSYFNTYTCYKSKPQYSIWNHPKEQTSEY